MSTALTRICQIYSLGTLKQHRLLKGGRSHTTIYLLTSKGEYVVKQLLSRHGHALDLNRFRNTAAIAHWFAKHGVSAVPPFLINGDVIVEIDASYYMVYPYVNANMLHFNKYGIKRCQHVAAALAQLHTLNPQVRAPHAWRFHYNETAWNDAYHYFRERHVFSIAPRLQKMQSTIAQCFADYERCLPHIEEDRVVSHRDIDRRNVLWKANGEFVLIDWDLAGHIDAAVELMYVVLGLSMRAKGVFDRERFSTLLTTYSAKRPIKTKDAEALVLTVLCNWLTWDQAQMSLLISGDYDLAASNEIAVGLRHSLDAVVYVMSVMDEIKKLWL